MFAVAIAALVVVACSGGAGQARTSDSTRSWLVLRLPGIPYLTAAAQNGPHFAVVAESVRVADLRTGKWIRVASAGAQTDHSAGVAGATVIWRDDEGGMSRTYRLRAASPSRQRRLARWFGPDAAWATKDGPFGGVAASGRNLVYSLILARTDDPNACIEKGKCRAYVRGGGTMLMSPGSLTDRRILSPARALAVDGDRVAAAIVRPGSLYTGKAQIVILNLATGERRFVGAPTRDDQLALDGDLLVGLEQHTDNAVYAVVHVWSIRARSAPLKTYRFRGGPSMGVAAPYLLDLDARNLFAIDVRNGRRRVISPVKSFDTLGPWVWRQRVYWVERFRGFSELRSAPLPSR
jgi:hypothetical protein